MKLSLTLLAIAGPSAAAFAPVTTARPTTALHATIENTKLVPPKKVEDLAETAQELYGKNVQTTYG
jgi:hypothetical protein